MKICLILGAYNPGQCGISDYVELLSEEFKKEGHAVKILSVDLKQKKYSFGRNLPSADLYSIQFAPYNFSEKGLLEKKLFNLACLLCSQKTHLNFHEIWIGAYPRAPFWERFTGWKQKRKIIQFVNHLKPDLITCSNSASLDRLILSGIKAHYLYLFGNITFAQNSKELNENFLKIALFGTPYKKFPYELLGQKLEEISEVTNSSIHIRILGRQRDDDGLNQLKHISQKYNFKLVEYGELSFESLSKELQKCNIGISTTPFDIIGKSGATTAMLEHGLPIITYDDADTPTEKLFIFKKFSDQVFLVDEEKLVERIISFCKKERKPFFHGVAYTAKEMLNLLNCEAC